MSRLDFQYSAGGIYLPRLGLWLDPHRAQTGRERVFISHAHSDHIARHREVILTGPTSKFIRERLGGRRHEHVLSFGTPVRFDPGDWQITLWPAGHMLGSAMALIEADGESLLYTGDFRLRRGAAAELCELRHADKLIMETTFGRPQFVFPPTAEAVRDLVNFCQESFDQSQTPVLLAYSLGKTQEVLSELAGTGWTFALHPQAAKMTRLYEQFGQRFPNWRTLGSTPCPERVVVVPPGIDRAPLLREIGPVRTAVVTGWALESSCRFRHRVDAAFPLSDHADFPGLIECVERVAPKQVFTLHGFAADFARSLRELGFDARALSEDEQLELKLG